MGLLKEQWTKRWLIVLAGMIAPYFYLVGWQYSHTFYREFGVDQAISRASFHEHIALGFQKTTESFAIGYLWLIKQSFWFYVCVFLGFIIIAAIYLVFFNTVDKFKRDDGRNKFLSWYREKLKSKRFEYSVLPVITSSIIVSAFTTLITVGLIIFTISTFGHRFAKRNVDTQKASYTACKPETPNPRHDCTFVYDGSELVLSGMIVGRSSSRISIYNGQTETIELNGHRIVHQFKEEMKE